MLSKLALLRSACAAEVMRSVLCPYVCMYACVNVCIANCLCLSCVVLKISYQSCPGILVGRALVLTDECRGFEGSKTLEGPPQPICSSSP